MESIDRSFASPEDNLAFDEALLDMCEAGCDEEVLRFWEPRSPFVVLGLSGRAREEVRLDECRRRGIPVLRRCSGGGTVLQGAGCLNYALVLRTPGTIAETNAFVLGRHRDALQPLLRGEVEIQGISDLAVAGRKFSGNAQRRRKRFLLFHGTFLLRGDFALMDEILPVPERQPSYRRGRSHAEFLMGAGADPDVVRKALREAWSARRTLKTLPLRETRLLAQERYSSLDWNLRF